MEDITWVRHVVSVPTVDRVVDCNMRNKDGKVVRMQRTYMVQQHDVYRMKQDGKVDNVLWHRGAKVGVV